MKDETFLERWSRRKAETRKPPEETGATEPEALPDAPAIDPATPMHSPPEPHPAELVDLETLSFESDFTVFMQKGVPEEVKRKALAKLWTSDPVLANLDGLTDYDLDLSPHGHGPFTGTSWRLGGGYSWLDALEKLGEPEVPEDGVPDDAAPKDAEVVAEVTGEVGHASTEGDPPDTETDPRSDDIPGERSRTDDPHVGHLPIHSRRFP